jgi:CRP-like cAMP-binding protein
VADKMKRETFEEGTVIIRQGEEGDKFYLIRRGAVDVIIDEGQPSREMLVLKEGDFFGEIALITGQPRTATVRAKERVECYTLDKVSFQEAIAASDTFKEQIYKAYFQRQ